jgi:hypothetical protein
MDAGNLTSKRITSWVQRDQPGLSKKTYRLVFLLHYYPLIPPTDGVPFSMAIEDSYRDSSELEGGRCVSSPFRIPDAGDSRRTTEGTADVHELDHAAAGAGSVVGAVPKIRVPCLSSDSDCVSVESCESPRRKGPKMGDTVLRELIQNYALWAREFSDSVARLGRFDRIGPSFIGAMNEVERCRALCLKAGDELSQHIDAQGRGSRRDTAGQS